MIARSNPTRYLRVLLPCLALALCAAVPAAAQGTGRVVGRVLDQASGSPIAGAQVEVIGPTTPLRATSAIDGRYTLLGVPAGPVAIRARMIGYQPKVVTGVLVRAGEIAGQDIALTAEVVQLEEITVTAAAEAGTVNRALEEQRVAVNIVSSISAEQISRSPDSDAGAAVQRVSGVTVEEGKYVVVRGLGGRYTNTNLNGSRLPSADPERKVVPLDLFPTGLLAGITTSKTFTADQPGDFSGGAVNLQTREFPMGRVTTLAVSSGFNTRATGQTLGKAPTTGTEWLGFAGNARQLPGTLDGLTSLQGVPQSQVNEIIGSFRNVWNPSRGNGIPSGSLALSVGGEDPLFGQPLGYVGSLSYAIGQEVRDDETRAIAFTGPGGVTIPQNAYAGQTARTSVLWGGLLNLSTRVGAASKLEFNNTYTRAADNEASLVSGFNDGLDEDLAFTRLTFVERSVRSHQLKGQHLLGMNHLLDWSASVTSVNREEPDRSDLVYLAEGSGPGALAPTAWYGSSRSATRTFSSVDESGMEGALNYRILLGDAVHQPSVKVGAMVRTNERTADSRAWDIINRDLTEAERAAPAEQIFSTYGPQGRLLLFLNGNGGRYTADDRLTAGFAQLELPLTNRLQLVGGVRVERSEIDVTSITIDGGDTTSVLRDTDLLPALTLNYFLTPTHQFRVSASRTLARPEYRELSPVSYFDILGGQRLFGFAGLERTLIQNLDARWEWYPNTGEVVSAAVFVKRFDQPIERVLVQTSDGNSPDATFRNAKAANNYGIEFEARKHLGFLARGLRGVTAFANVTLMQSEIEVANDDISSLTNGQRPMVGQSEYVVNAGLGWVGLEDRLSGTLLYNVAGPRIFEAGILPLPDTYEQARHMVDVSLSYDLHEAMSLKASGRNLLDSPFELTQGTVTRLRYRTGRQFSLGLSMDL